MRESNGKVALSGTAVSSDDVVAYSNLILESPNVSSVEVLGVAGLPGREDIAFSFNIILTASEAE